MERAAGLLLHPTSLPGDGPCGTLGAGADRFLDWLEAAGITLWQVLPLGPVGYGDSPYTPSSVFAGNPLLISAHQLVSEGWLRDADLSTLGGVSDPTTCDFEAARRRVTQLAELAYRRLPQAPERLRSAYRHWSETEAGNWLDDWALYAALKEQYDLREWTAWPAELAGRRSEALDRARRELAESIERHRLTQYLFETQWSRVYRSARERGIRILGDLPIYAALDSADTWSRPELFDLDESGRPHHVAGVPPDYFSATGQLWGNPLYRWDRLAEEGFAWWIERLRVQLGRADLLRLDHFRGFEAYWEVPAGENTAENGRWRGGPGGRFFHAVREELGDLPLVAEDLGVITPAVEALRDELDLPGMRVIQFAFDAPHSPHLPHNYPRHSVAYTGTHDNDTARGWFSTASDVVRRRAMVYTGCRGEEEIAQSLLRSVWTSVAEVALAPVQDVLGLGGNARLNHPGRDRDNWTWRVREHELTAAAAAALRDLTENTGRLPAAPERSAEAGQPSQAESP